MPDYDSAANFSIIVPYRELEKLLDAANKINQMETLVRRMDERYAAMQFMYRDLMEKVAEMNRYL